MRNALCVFGIPIDQVTTEEAAERVIEWIKTHQSDQNTKNIATINLDFISNVYPLWGLTSHNPELLKILRMSKLNTVDGMPLVWLSWLLGNPLEERVTGVDMCLFLFQLLAKNDQSIFFLGGFQPEVEKAAKILRKNYSGLKIAGIECPIISMESGALVQAEEQDCLLAEKINAARPDFLIISLGNPKQELWFYRMAHRLHCPAAIGLGGTYLMISGAITRAPEWMRNWGLEWVWRLFQDPKHLWKRYLLCFLKYMVHSIPLVLYHRLNSLIYRSHENHVLRPLLFLSKNRSITAIRLPRVLDKRNAEVIASYWDEALSGDLLLILVG